MVVMYLGGRHETSEVSQRDGAVCGTHHLSERGSWWYSAPVNSCLNRCRMANRRWKNCFSPVLYRNRNAIERMFGRLKDFRRIATRYDRLEGTFLAAVCLAATVICWL